MGAHVDYDTDKRIIYVTTAPTLEDGNWVVDIDVKIDIYSDGKEDWLTTDALNKFMFPVRSVGGDTLPGSKALGATFFLDSGWKIKPYEADHVLRVNGNLYSEDGTSPFVQTTGIYNIMVINTVSSLVDSTVQQLSEIEYASFNGGVTIDNTSSYSGAEYPNGTPQQPINNLANAMEIAEERGFTILYVIGNLTVDDGGDYSEMSFIGASMTKSTLEITDLANVENCEFYEATVEGTLDGNAKLKNCRILDLNYIYGVVEECMLGPGTITLSGLAEAHFLDCWSGVAGGGTPIINMGGSGQTLGIRNYNGGLTIENKTGASDRVGIDLNSGHIILDSTVTAGEISIRGIGKLTDDSLGATVLADDLLNRENITKPSWETVWVDTVNGVSGIEFPIGTASLPSNNETDAWTIAFANNIKKFFVTGDYVLANDWEGFTVAARSVDSCNIDINGKAVTNMLFENVSLSGISVSHFNAKNCELSNITGLDAHLDNCILSGSFSILDGETLNGDRCTFPSNTIFDLNNTGSINLANSGGLITLTNATDPACNVAITGTYVLTLDDSCTYGTAFIGGTGILTNNSTMTVVDRTLPQAVWDESASAHQLLDTTGEALTTILGLSKHNFRIGTQTYDGAGRMTSATVKIYSTADDTNNDTNEIASYTSSATYDVNGRCTDFRMVKD